MKGIHIRFKNNEEAQVLALIQLLQTLDCIDAIDAYEEEENFGGEGKPMSIETFLNRIKLSEQAATDGKKINSETLRQLIKK